MNQKTTIIVAIIAITIIGITTVYTLNNIKPNNGIQEAHSLHFSISKITREGTLGNQIYYIKKMNSTNIMIRAEKYSTNGVEIYIVNGVQQKAWREIAGEWQDLSNTFTVELEKWKATIEEHKETLSNWSGTGKYNYTDSDGVEIEIHDIKINLSIADSIFNPAIVI